MTVELTKGTRIAGKYEVIESLGSGAFGTIYRALQHPVEREVALKIISPMAAGDELEARFFREAKAIARLNHPGAVILHDYGEHQGLLYMVMELVEGRELRSIIRESAPLRLDRSLDYARQILGVLVEAHRLDLVHRDLKPANIMVVTDAAGEERLKILDFGIAKLLDERGERYQTQLGTVVGSPSYFAPEQASGVAVGPAADQYSLGIMLYEMLSGRKPFQGDSLVALVTAHQNAPVPPLPLHLGVPNEVERFIRRALEKNPAARYASAKAMLDALDALAQVPIAAPESRPAPVEESPVGRGTAPLPGLDPKSNRRGPQVTPSPVIQTAELPALDPAGEREHLAAVASAPPTVPDPIPAVPQTQPGPFPAVAAPRPPPAVVAPPPSQPSSIVSLEQAQAELGAGFPTLPPVVDYDADRRAIAQRRRTLFIAVAVCLLLVALGIGLLARKLDEPMSVAVDAALVPQAPPDAGAPPAAPDAAVIDAAAVAPDAAVVAALDQGPGDAAAAADAGPPDVAVDAERPARPRPMAPPRRTWPVPRPPKATEDRYQKL